MIDVSARKVLDGRLKCCKSDDDLVRKTTSAEITSRVKREDAMYCTLEIEEALSLSSFPRE